MNMNDDNTDRKSLGRLADALVEDILGMSDEEILTEFGEDGGNAAQYAADMRERFSETVLSAKKARLAAAAAGAAASRERTSHRRRDPVESALARERLASALKRGTSLPMTLAARKEEDLSDADVQGMLEDLEELGAIDPPEDQESED